MELRRPLRHRGERIGDGGERLPVNDDLGDGVDGDGFRRRDDGGDGFAHVANAVHRQRVVPAADGLGAGPSAALGPGALERHGSAEPAELLPRHHPEHSRPLGRRGGVDLPDARVGVGAPHERDVV